MLSNGFHTLTISLQAHNKPTSSHKRNKPPNAQIKLKKNVLKIIDNSKNKRYNYSATQFNTGGVKTP